MTGIKRCRVIILHSNIITVIMTSSSVHTQLGLGMEVYVDACHCHPRTSLHHDTEPSELT